MTTTHGAGCLCQACTRERLALRPTMGERCSLRRQLAGAGIVLALAGAVVFGVNDVKLYGGPGSPNAGIVVYAPAGLGCLGFEIWGSPGIFGGTDPGSCDI